MSFVEEIMSFVEKVAVYRRVYAVRRKSRQLHRILLILVSHKGVIKNSFLKKPFKMKLYTKKTMKFEKPTLEDVERQFELKGVPSKTEPQKFYAHYESNGWYVGRAKMKSWRAAVAGWVLRMNDYGPRNNQKNEQFTREASQQRMADNYRYFQGKV